MEENKHQNEEIELECEPIVIQIPVHAVKLNIEATVYENDELQNVYRSMDMQEIQAAFKDAEENYIPDDTVYTLTEEGKRYAEQLLRDDPDFFKRGLSLRSGDDYAD